MQQRIVIVIKGGMVQDVLAKFPNQYDVEIIDLDVQDEEELRANEERLSSIEQYLTRQEV